jgi:hypothetical protein
MTSSAFLPVESEEHSIKIAKAFKHAAELVGAKAELFSE